MKDLLKDIQSGSFANEFLNEMETGCKNFNELRKENENLRKTTIKLQDEIQGVKREQARQGRKLEVITPFICSHMDCTERIRASIKDITKRKENNNHKIED